MKVIVVGGTGTIGREVVAALEARHEVVVVGHTHGELQTDIMSRESIQRLFTTVGAFEALVSAVGAAAWKPLAELSDDDFQFSLDNKLMGQIDLVRIGMTHVSDGGSFTLTSGILADEPAPGSAAVSLVNAGINAFVRAAALELQRGIRVNAVSPPWVSETLESMGQSGADGLPAREVARAYVESVEGTMTGAVIAATGHSGR